MSVLKVDPLILLIIDGFGIGGDPAVDAIAQAEMPAWRGLLARWPHAELAASGVAVGLPDGQMGNSEVGHLNIGSGQRVPQELPRINAAIQDGSFYQRPELLRAMTLATNGRLHLLSLLGPGGVHAADHHLVALAEAAQRSGITSIFVHLFLDGRDTPPRSALGYLASLERRLTAAAPAARITTISGRYFAMDRDQRWERTSAAVAAIVSGEGLHAANAVAAIKAGYARGETDEFIAPTVITPAAGVDARMQSSDTVIHANFRADRARQLVAALSASTFPAFARPPQLPVRVVGMSSYGDEAGTPAIFGPSAVPSLAECISAAGLRQFHVAETEKYAHVTYFLNGGKEEAFPGERRLLIPSPAVATYDFAPEMRAAEIADAVVASIAAGDEQLIVANLANPDMVGHTGNWEATIRACEAVDAAVGRIAAAAAARPNALLVITGDHGNAEQMRTRTGEHVTSHTSAKVPLLVAGDAVEGASLADGELSDILPTLAELSGFIAPSSVTGHSLLRKGE
ncbi:MAG: 2,3-bisphosphoglycerate-independent phosphoglycerate mutase [Chloroflexota bacterium]